MPPLIPRFSGVILKFNSRRKRGEFTDCIPVSVQIGIHICFICFTIYNDLIFLFLIVT